MKIEFKFEFGQRFTFGARIDFIIIVMVSGGDFSVTNNFVMIFECLGVVLMFQVTKLELRRLIEFRIKEVVDSISNDSTESGTSNVV